MERNRVMGTAISFIATQESLGGESCAVCVCPFVRGSTVLMDDPYRGAEDREVFHPACAEQWYAEAPAREAAFGSDWTEEPHELEYR